MLTPGAGTPLVLVPDSPLSERVLAAAGVQCRAVRSPIEDPRGLVGRVGVVEAAEGLAYFRARSVAVGLLGGPVLATCTLVQVGERVLGAPPDRPGVAEMLRALSGTRHTVVTGVALVAGIRRLLAAERTTVTMLPIPAEEIDRYVAAAGPGGRVGPYAPAVVAERFVVGVEGSYSNLLGMPVELVLGMLGEMGEESCCRPYAALATA